MDIDLLAQLVRDIILEEDEVTLPGVGTFVAETVPASFSDKLYTINPPYRRLSFRQRQGKDDFLVHRYASISGLDEERSREILKAFLSEMKEVLKIRKTIIFPNLGRLRATKENHFFFVCDEDPDIFPQGFGLEPISLKARDTGNIPRLELVVPDTPAPTPAPAPALTPDPTPTPDSAAPAQKPPVQARQEKKRILPKIILAIIIICIVILAATAVLGRVAPEFIDKFLYTNEELEILRY